MTDHTYEDQCKDQWFWCRLHWWPGFDSMGCVIHQPYPFEVMVKSSEAGWQEVTVHCGPGAFLPKRSKTR
jgi:hypothetical protein